MSEATMEEALMDAVNAGSYSNQPTREIVASVMNGPLATALAEARAEGRRQGLEEGARTAEAYARVRIEPHASVLRTFAVTLRSLATTPAETQKPETGESA